MEPTPGDVPGPKADDTGPFRTLKMLAVGCAPAALSYGMLTLANATSQVLLYAASFVVFGFLTPIVVANAKRRASVVVSMLLAAAFLGMGSGTHDEGFNMLPWWLFAWGLFPSLAISLSIRLSPLKYLPFVLPVALCAAVVVRLLLPDAMLAVGGIVALLADMLILRQYAKMKSEAP